MFARRPQRRRRTSPTPSPDGHEADIDSDNESVRSDGHKSGYDDAASELSSLDSSSCDEDNQDAQAGHPAISLDDLAGESRADTTTSGATTEQGESEASTDDDSSSDDTLANECRQHITEVAIVAASIEKLLQQHTSKQQAERKKDPALPPCASNNHRL